MKKVLGYRAPSSVLNSAKCESESESRSQSQNQKKHVRTTDLHLILTEKTVATIALYDAVFLYRLDEQIYFKMTLEFISSILNLNWTGRFRSHDFSLHSFKFV